MAPMPGILDKPVAVQLPIRGGQYRAIEYADGSADLLDVPIMGELPPGTRRNTEHVGEKWQRAALADAQLAQAEQYMRPVHLEHHHPTGTVKTFPAGKLELSRVGRERFRGKTMSVLFANFRAIPAESWAKIKAGEWPYASVEVVDWDVPKIASLALLDDDAPFFEFALITVGKVTQAAARDQLSKTPFGVLQNGRPIFHCLGAMTMPDEKDDKLAGDTDDDNGADEEFMTKLKAALTTLGLLQVETGDEEEEDDADLTGDVDDADTPKDLEEEDTESSNMNKGKTITLQAQLSALQDKDAKRDRDDAVAMRLSTVIEKLEGDGYALSKKTHERLQAAATAGQKTLNLFVEQYRDVAVVDSPETFDKFESGGGGGTGAAAASALLSKIGASPEQLDALQAASEQYDELVAHGHAVSGDREAYCKRALAAKPYATT